MESACRLDNLGGASKAIDLSEGAGQPRLSWLPRVIKPVELRGGKSMYS